MPNKWVEHVKKFARDNNMSYGCALTDPDIRRGYEKAPIKKTKAKLQDEEREKRQDEEEARVNARNREEEKKSVANEPITHKESKKMLKKLFEGKDLSSLAKVLKPQSKEEKLIGQLHDEYLRLNKVPKYTNKVRKAIQDVEGMANELIRPILKKQLEQGFFPTEWGFKYGEMKFKVASFADRYRGGKEKKVFEFFLDGKKLDEEEDIGIQRKSSEWYDPYVALYEALSRYYRYRVFSGVAGMRNVEEFKKWVPNLI